MKRILCYFAAATHFLFMGGLHILGAVAAKDWCANSSALAKIVTCNFANGDSCGWNLSSNGVAGWVAESGNLIARIQANENRTVKVQSRVVCSANNKFRLIFKYMFEKEPGCELSVIYVSENAFKQVWQNDTAGTTGTVEKYVESPQDNFWLVFEAKKIEQYIWSYCAVRLMWITFIQTDTLTFSASSEDDVGRLSGGTIAGIIISLIIVIAVVVVVAFLLLRRRTTGAKLPFQKCLERLRNAVQSSSASTTDTHVSARSNRPVIDGPYPEITSESGHLPKTKDYYSVPSDSLHVNSRGLKPGHGTHCAVSAVPESSNYYSMPRDEDDVTVPPGGGKTNLGYVAEDDGGYSTPDDIDRLEMDRQKSNTTQSAPSGKIGAAGDSYKISFQPPHARSSRKAADTYHHINPLKHADTDTVHSTGVGMHEGVQDDDKEYKVPRSDHAEYSLATDPGDHYDRPPASPTGKTQDTDLTGKRGAPRANNTDYNHLKLKDGGFLSPAGATSGKGKSQGVYNHLEGQIDNYNRVDFDGRGGDKQTGNSGGPYNHLGD